MHCPSDDASGRVFNDPGTPGEMFARSNVAINFGAGGMCKTCITTTLTATAANMSGFLTDGAFQLEQARKLDEFTDGTANTALASEVISGKADAGTPFDHRGAWAYLIGFYYTHLDTPNNSLGDVGPVGSCVKEQDMPCGTDVASKVYLWHDLARSRHPGGVNVAFVDGHVGFVPDVIAFNVWQALGNRADGTTLGIGEY
jgi:prepilin-type processing-associated H-X9-DG protein